MWRALASAAAALTRLMCHSRSPLTVTVTEVFGSNVRGGTTGGGNAVADAVGVGVVDAVGVSVGVGGAVWDAGVDAAGCGARAPPGRSFGSAQDAVASKANAASDAAKRRETIMARRLPGRRLQFGESRARGVRVRSGPVRGVR